jgi:broad specificity phosphatase PhoE
MRQLDRNQSWHIEGAIFSRWPSSVYPWDFISQYLRRNDFKEGRIYFFRHGQTYLNRKQLNSGQLDCPLTARGRTAAAKLAFELPLDYTQIFSSPLTRSIETLEIAFDGVSRKPDNIILDARLIEKSLGALEGKPRRFIPEYEEGDLDFAPPDGETYRDLGQRCFSFMIDIHKWASRAIDKKPVIVVFTHMGPLRVFSSGFGRVSTSKEMMASGFSNLNGFSADLSEFMLPNYFVGEGVYGRRVSTNRGVPKFRSE